MGADGGYCYLHCTNRAELQRLAGCFLWRYANTSCRAIKGSQPGDGEASPPGLDYVEGGYGTDCAADYDTLVGMIEVVLDEKDCWDAMPTDPRDLTFRELREDLETDPEFNPDWGLFGIRDARDLAWIRWWAMSVFSTLAEHLAGSTQGYSWAKVDEHLLDMTLREWCKALRKIGCDHTYTVETWT